VCALLDMVQAALQRCFGSQLAESVAFVQVGESQGRRSIPGGEWTVLKFATVSLAALGPTEFLIMDTGDSMLR
jgi:hypothetical protein